MVVLPRVEVFVLWGWLIHISLGYSYELKAHVTFTSDTADYGQPLVGLFASYGEASTDRRRGKLVLPSETYGCSESNATLPRISSGGSFIVVLPLSECNDYFQARRAYRDNAAGVVFYYTSDSSRDSTTSGNGIVLAIPVAVVKVDNDLLDYITGQKSPQYTDVAIEGVNYTVFQQSRTFYFIVTAFCILILLSCLWFFTSYFRRCRHSVRNRRRQARAQNSARKAISKLKVRYYKVPKGSQDRENCAVCLELYSVNDVIRVLPCKHEFHRNCVDPWLKLKQTCPLCKVNITEKSATEQTRHHLHTNPHRMLSLSDSISSTSDSSSIADGSTRPQQQERRLLDSAEVAINVDAEEETIAPDTPIV